MRKIQSLIGQRFGSLVVLSKDIPQNNKTKWLCRCDCGNEVSVYASNLLRGFSRHCNNREYHIRKPSNTLGYGESSFNVYFKLLQESANRRKIEFNLTKEEVKLINSQNCVYCGSKPFQQVNRERKLTGKYVYTGIDRVDSSKGYVIGNVVPCCKHCNSAKMKLTLEEFKSLIVSIYNNWASK